MQSQRKTKSNRCLALPSVLVLALATGGACGSLNDTEESPQPSTSTAKPGAIAFSITDAPVDNAEHVYVTIARIEVSKALDSENDSESSTDDSETVSLTGDGQSESATSQAEWIVIPLDESQEIDLLALQGGDSTPLAHLESLEAGQYNQIRLFLAEDNEPRIVLNDGTEAPVFIPSAAKSGIKIVSPFEVVADQELNLTIDFDLRKSLVSTGNISTTSLSGSQNSHSSGTEISGEDAAAAQNGGYDYIIRPTLRLVNDREAKTMEVQVNQQAQIACAYAAGEAKDETSDCANAFNSTRVREGSASFGFMPPGEYEVRAFLEDGTFEDEEPVSVEAPAE